MSTKTAPISYDIINAPAVDVAFQAAMRFMAAHPHDEFVVFAVEGLPLLQQRDSMGDAMLQAMANDCGAPSMATMKAAFEKVLAHTESSEKRTLIRPKHGAFLSNTGNFAISPEVWS